jgi:hypothetical protein
MRDQLTRANHYVPQCYLKRWANSSGKIWTSRLLVPDERVPVWKQCSIRGVAHHQNLYTRLVEGQESDDVEQWLNEEFESPAQVSIDRAVAGERLTPDDWHRMIRFLAAQDVRSPARLHESMRRWHRTLPEIVQSTLEESVATLKQKNHSVRSAELLRHPYADYFPMRVSKQLAPDSPDAIIGVETVAGRGLWLFSLKHLLTSTLRVLSRHKWTVLICPEGQMLATSDDPVIKLNYRSPGDYNFDGGWGSDGTEILMPIAPGHILYTKVGSRNPPTKGTVLKAEMAQAFQRFTIEHAHRFIFASMSNDALFEYRVREVNLDKYKFEKDQWQQWHSQQMDAEHNLRRE